MPSNYPLYIDANIEKKPFLALSKYDSTVHCIEHNTLNTQRKLFQTNIQETNEILWKNNLRIFIYYNIIKTYTFQFFIKLLIFTNLLGHSQTRLW